MELIVSILTGLGLAVPAGLNAYIPLLVVSICSRFGLIQLPEGLSFLGEWWIILIIAILLIIEVLADKFPAVDSVNDVIQTVVRPTAGAVVAVAASGDANVSPVLMGIAGVILAGGVHATKASVRPILTGSTIGTGTPVVSTAEDVTSLGTSLVAVFIPLLVILVLAITVLGVAWVFVKFKNFKRKNVAG